MGSFVLPLGVLVPLLLASAVAAASLTQIRRTGAGIVACRLAVAGLLLLVGLGWSGIETATTGGDTMTPRRVVLLDVSRSMSITDAAGESRLSEAVRQLRASGFDTIDVYAFGERVRPVDDLATTTAEDEQSDIPAALDHALRLRPREVLLVSDGQMTGGPVAASLDRARAMRTPISTWTVGEADGRPHLSLRAQRRRIVAFAGDPVLVQASVDGGTTRMVRVDLLDEATGGTIDSQVVQTDLRGHADVGFLVSAPPGGTARFRLRAESDQPDAADRVAHDNSDTVVVRGLVGPLKVVLLEGRPDWRSRDLTRALRSDPGIALTAVYQLGPDRRLIVDDVTSQTDDVAVNLTDAAVVVLGGQPERTLNDAEMKRVVERTAAGRPLLLLGRSQAGPEVPLATLDPWRGEQTLPADVPAELRHDGLRLAYRRHGRGDVIGVHAARSWQRMIAPGEDAPDVPWAMLVRWLAARADAGDGDSAIAWHPASPRAGDLIEVSVRPLDAAEPLRIRVEALASEAPTPPVDLPAEIHHGEASVRLPALAAGRYRLDVERVDDGASLASDVLVVEAADVESLRTDPNPELMKHIAEATGGAVVDGVPPLEAPTSGVSNARSILSPRWDHPALLATLVLLLLSEWTLRRRRGLP